jgi:tetratricopeptide (TPR) repeat protein
MAAGMKDRNPARPPLPLWAFAAGAALLTFLAFLPALQAGFVNWDDDVNFVSNRRYRGLGPAQLHYMLTDTYGHYMPLTWFTLGLDYVLYGMNPAGYHATSLLFHAANAAVFFFVMLLLLRRAQPAAEEGRRRWGAFAAALFYSVHPLRAESAVWVTERRDVVCGLFFLLSLLFWLKFQDEPARRKWLFLSLAAFVGSLLSKAMGMTLPVVLLALDYYPLRRLGPGKPIGPLIREKLPFIALMVVSILSTRALQQNSGAIYPASKYPLVDILLQPGYRTVFYMVKTVLPFGLSPLYPYRSLTQDFRIVYPLAGAALLALLAWVWARRERAPALLSAAVSYGALISPVVIWQAGPHYAADRYSYLASLALASLVGGLIVLHGRPAGLGVAAALAGLFLLSWNQAKVWHDSFSLWDHAIAVGTDSFIPYTSRGAARAERGDLDGAMEDFRTALKMEPKEKRALNNLAQAELKKGNTAAAEELATRAIQCDPTLVSAWHNRALIRVERKDYAGGIQDFDQAIASAAKPQEEPVSIPDLLCNRAIAKQRAEDLPGAEADATRAMELDPESARAAALRGTIRVRRRRLDEALADFTRTRELSPGSPGPRVARGMARAESGDLDGAIVDYTEAIRLDPRDLAAFVNRGAARAAKNDDAGAMADFSQAITLDPNRSVIWSKRGRMRARQRDLAGALADCTEAIRLDPRNAEALGVRGTARGDRGDLRGAIADFEEALRVAPADWNERKMFQEMLAQARRMLK